VSKYRWLILIAVSLVLSVYLSDEGLSAPPAPIGCHHIYLPIIRTPAMCYLPIIHGAPISPISPVPTAP
jgi:hypothetical protein